MRLAPAYALVGLWALGLTGCTGDTTTPAATISEADRPPAELLAQSWMLQAANDEVRAPFETDGWIKLVTRRDIPGVVRVLGKQEGLPAARAHADAAAMYRQAALVEANALIQSYVELPKEWDPAGASHLLTVSYLVVGDTEKAKAAGALASALTDDPSTSWHAAWAEASWPPDISAIPLSLGEPTAGEWPHQGNLPHYDLPEQTDEKRPVGMGDPGALVAAALWHDEVARIAAGDQAALVDAYDARYLLPVEALPEEAGDLPLELIFGSELLHPKDADFLIAVKRDGYPAVDAWADKSLLADLAKRSSTDGKIDPERARDVSQALRRTILDEMETLAGSSEDFHRTFADVARTSTLRGLALVARASGDEYTEGVLRISALDHSASAATANLPWLLSMCAYDAGNRFPARANELLHNMITRVPELETARYGLDVLALRVSRANGGGPPPGM
ncbi:MAG: hypothetical protein KC912_12420 [Proteobacteria bacterium]|nr:hypothetical protein [Pseudomonadota bacterium]